MLKSNSLMLKIVNPLLSLCLACIMILISASSSAVSAATFTPDFSLYSDAAVLVNLDTGITVMEKNPDKQLSPAQLSNIMAAIVILENCTDISGTMITADNELYSDVYEYAYPDDVRYGDIYNGDVLSVEEMLYALMLTSSFEAANNLAYYFGNNSIKAFVQMMNDKAKEIGAENTNFTNANGLYDQRQFTTAHDMALITQYALKIPRFTEIATAQSYTPVNQNLDNGHSSGWGWTHSNTMMSSSSDYYYEGAAGIKTGNLSRTGRNLVTMASSNGSKYLVVLLGAPFTDAEDNLTFYHLDDAENLFDWAYENMSYETLVTASEEVGELDVVFADQQDYIRVKPAEDFTSMWIKSMNISPEKSIVYFDNIVYDDSYVIAPIQQNQVVGRLDIKISGEVIGSVDLIAADSVDRSSTKYNTKAATEFLNSKWLKYGLILFASLSLLYIIICAYAYKVSAKRRPVKSLYSPKYENKKSSIHKKHRR